MLIDRMMVKHLEKAARLSVDKVLSIYGHVVAGNPYNTKDENLGMTFVEIFGKDYVDKYPGDSSILSSQFEGICYLLAIASGTSGQAMPS